MRFGSEFCSFFSSLVFWGERGKKGEGGRGAESKHLAGTGIPLLREVIVDEFLE